MPPDAAAAAAPTVAPNSTPTEVALTTDADLVAKLEGHIVAPEAAPEAPPAAPEPQTPKDSALLRSIQRRERDLVADRQRLQAQIAQSEATIQARVDAGIERALKERFADPRAAVKALGALGLKDQDLADGLLHKDQASPEEMARKALEEAAALKEQLRARDAAEAKTRSESAYLSTAKRLADAGKLPHATSEWNEQELVAETYRMIAELNAECRAKGIPVPAIEDERFLAALDKRAKVKQDWREERKKAGGATAATPGQSGGGHQGGQTGDAATTTTLGKQLGERATVTVPDPLTMSRDDLIAESIKKVSTGFNVKPR